MSTLPQAFLDTVAANGNVDALVADIDQARPITYRAYADLVARAVTGFRSLGVGPGDRVALLLPNCVEFHIADLAIQFCGATPFSVYTAFTSEQLTYVLDHAGADVVVVGEHFVPAAEAASTTSRRALVVVGDASRHTSWKRLVDNVSAPLDASVVTADSCATIIYTSGTTGLPKGVQLSQANVVHNARGYIERTGVSVVGLRMVSYLPMAHIAERAVSYYAAIIGAKTVWPCPRVSDLPLYLRAVRPQALFGVPLVWERLQTTIVNQLATRSWLLRFFAWSTRSSTSWIPGLRQAGRLSQRNLGRIILRRAGMNELRYCSSGGAAIEASVIVWFRALGLPLTESYGMSESTGPMTWTPDKYRKGAAGQPLPGVQIKVDADGELLCKGPAVFSGYLHDQLRTDEALTDGWLRTGDLGRIDRHGFVHVHGRKKELIVTRGGENVAPSSIETLLTANALIAGACVSGDDRPYLVAVIALDEAAVERWFDRQQLPYASLEAASTHERLVAAIGAVVTSVNEQTSRVEQLRRYKILDHSWEGDMEVLTPTLKPKRRNVIARYHADIDALYS